MLIRVPMGREAVVLLQCRLMRELKDFSARRWSIVLNWSLTFCTVSLLILQRALLLLLLFCSSRHVFHRLQGCLQAENNARLLSPISPLSSLGLRMWMHQWRSVMQLISRACPKFEHLSIPV